ncbi:MAG: hypothetical protein N3F67_06145 [Acidilobaceae archaeon]|nr:hypothetical protein [Acidilobaceae archaeon]
MGVEDVAAAFERITSVFPHIGLQGDVSYYLALAGLTILFLVTIFSVGFLVIWSITTALNKPPSFLAKAVIVIAIFLVFLAIILP